MKKICFSKIIAVIMCICLTVSICSINNVLASETYANDYIHTIENNSDTYIVPTTYYGSEISSSLDESTDGTTLSAIEKSNILVIPNDINNSDVIASDASPRAIVAIPLLAIFGEALLATLTLITCFIVIDGVKAFPITAELDAGMRSRPYPYYAAEVRPKDNVYIGGALTFDQALKRASLGGDVWAQDLDKAFALAAAVKPGTIPEGPEIGSEPGKQLNHFHVRGRVPNCHILFGH